MIRNTIKLLHESLIYSKDHKLQKFLIDNCDRDSIDTILNYRGKRHSALSLAIMKYDPEETVIREEFDDENIRVDSMSFNIVMHLLNKGANPRLDLGDYTPLSYSARKDLKLFNALNYLSHSRKIIPYISS